MRDVVIYQLLSLDGVSEEPQNWFSEGGPEYLENLTRVLVNQTDVLLGRTTYDYWADYWPNADFEPFASFINQTTKHVASSTPPERPWQNTVHIDGPLLDYVRTMKRGEGGSIGLHGSTSLGRSLIAAGLVDELEFVVAPTIAGNGAKLFAESSAVEKQRFDLLNLERTALGTVFARYRRA